MFLQCVHVCFIALHIASGSQHTDCVRILLQHGAVDEEDSSGVKPSMLAVHKDIKQLFVNFNDSVT